MDAISARAAGALAERERIATILDLPEASGREALARHLALKTDFDPKAAAIALAAAPKGRSAASLDYEAGAAAARALLK
ncbi:MAG: hypothetical protein EKK29_16425 [Hyphomicrobiales bacterium]|nr:MAG: hypothetical protein EKK29_16425 [Hyphomicrobiales bacterium]